MTISEQLEKLYAKNEFANGKYNLSRISAAVERFGNPQQAYKTIHITGTNGKGSTAKMLATILAKKYTVGLFTSPHLVKANERIQVNNEQISDATFAAYLAQLEQHANELTFFETMTMAALLYFRDRKVDYAILEVGMGGMLDATNVVDAKIAVIASISLDHTKTLGSTTQEIANDKAGIIKKRADVFVTVQNRTLGNIFLQHCMQKEAKLHWVQPCTEKLGLLGEFQQYNAGLALAVSRHIGMEEKHVLAGLQEVQWPGRMQFVSDNMLLDGAHNQAALESLGSYLKKLNKPITLLYGSSHKRTDAALKHIPYTKLVFTQPDVEFATPMELFTLPGEKIASVADALAHAKRITDQDGILVVTGSLYLVGNVLDILDEKS